MLHGPLSATGLIMGRDDDARSAPLMRAYIRVRARGKQETLNLNSLGNSYGFKTRGMRKGQ